MTKKRTTLTREQHTEIAKVIFEADKKVAEACKFILEAYGWSSRPGKKAEKLVLTHGRLKNFLRLKGYMAYGCSFPEVYEYVDPVASVRPTLPYPHKMSNEQHTLVATKLKEAGDALATLAIDTLQHAHGKTDRRVKTCFGISSKIDALRSDLDDMYCKEYPTDRPPYSPYHGEQTQTV